MNRAYQEISGKDNSRWKCHGTNSYCIAGIHNESIILKQLIELSDRGESIYTFLDVGAGDHGCVKELAIYINDHRYLFPNITSVHLVSLSGDCAIPYEKLTGICKVSFVSRFKIEDLKTWISPSDELIKTYESNLTIHRACLDLMRILALMEPLAPKNLLIEEIHLDADQKLLDLSKQYDTIANEHNLPNLDQYDSVTVEQTKNKLSAIMTDLSNNSNLAEEFEILKIIRSLNLPIAYDSITSSFCLRHLIDPTSLLQTIYNMLTTRGIFLADGFHIIISDTPESPSRLPNPKAASTIFEILENSGVPYLIDVQDIGKPGSRRICGFLMKKQDEKKLEFEFQCHGIRQVEDNWGIGSNLIMNVKPKETWKNQTTLSEPSYYSESRYSTGKSLASPLAEYDFRLGSGLEQAGLLARNARTLLLINSLLDDGINPGTYKIEECQVTALKKAICQEYPEWTINDDENPDLDLIQQFYFYRSINNQDLFELLICMESTGLTITRNMILYCIRKKEISTDFFSSLIKIFKEQITKIKETCSDETFSSAYSHCFSCAIEYNRIDIVNFMLNDSPDLINIPAQKLQELLTRHLENEESNREIFHQLLNYMTNKGVALDHQWLPRAIGAALNRYDLNIADLLFSFSEKTLADNMLSPSGFNLFKSALKCGDITFIQRIQELNPEILNQFKTDKLLIQTALDVCLQSKNTVGLMFFLEKIKPKNATFPKTSSIRLLIIKTQAHFGF